MRTLDIACGSGFLTRHVSGLVVGLDQSRSMVDLAQSRLPDGMVMVGDALDLPFAGIAIDGGIDTPTPRRPPSRHHRDRTRTLRVISQTPLMPVTWTTTF